MNISTLTIKDILKQLQSEKFLTSFSEESIADTLLLRPSKTPTPWFVRGLIMFSAWLSAMFFLFFLFSMELLQPSSTLELIVWGVIFCSMTTIFRRHKLENDFVHQLTFAFNIAGQLLIALGLHNEFDTAAAALIMMSVEIILIIVYPDQTFRFLSTIIFISALNIYFYDLDIPNAFHLIAIFLAVGSVFIWEKESSFVGTKLAVYYKPIGYGLVVALLAMLIISVLPGSIEKTISNWWVSTLGLTVILVFIEYRLLTLYDISFKNTTSLVLFAGTFICFASAIQAPGLIAAVLVLVVGFHRNNRILTGLAFAFLTFFLGAYYYHLDITLLMKSYTLMGTGAIFLFVRYLIGKTPSSQ